MLYFINGVNLSLHSIKRYHDIFLPTYYFISIAISLGSLYIFQLCECIVVYTAFLSLILFGLILFGLKIIHCSIAVYDFMVVEFKITNQARELFL